MLKKNLKFFFTGCAIFLVLFFGLALVVILAIKDEPPHDVSDLLRQEPILPKDQDAFPLLVEAEKALQERKELRKAIKEIVYQEEWDPELAKKALATNQRTLEILQQASSLQGLNLPQDLLAHAEEIQKWKALWGLLSLQALALHRENQQAAALHQAMALLKMALWRDKSSINEHMAELPTETRAKRTLSLLRHLLRTSDLSPQAYAEAAAALAELSPQPDDLATTLKSSFRLHSAYLAEQMLKLQDHARQKTPVRFILKNVPYAFMPNRTLREMAEAHRLVLQQKDKPCIDMQFKQPPLSVGSDFKLFFEFILGSNGFGKISLNSALYDVMNMATNHCSTKTELEGTRLLLGLRCFHAKTGQFPSSLEQLVPECLHSLSSDGFYGLPWTYDAVAKKLWITKSPQKNDFIQPLASDYTFDVDFQRAFPTHSDSLLKD